MSSDRSGKTKILFVNTNEDKCNCRLEMVKYTQHKIHKVGNRDGITIFKGNLSLRLNYLWDDNFNLLNIGEFNN